MNNLWLKVDNFVAKREIVLSNFFFCRYVFKKPSAAEASESIYMRERVNSCFPKAFPDVFQSRLLQICYMLERFIYRSMHEY